MPDTTIAPPPAGGAPDPAGLENGPGLPDDLDGLDADELRRLIVSYRTRQRLGLYWETNEIERERLLVADLPFVAPVHEEAGVRTSVGAGPWPNLVIEGDNFDALRLLRRTHLGQVRVVCVDPPYNRGKKDLVYNDRYLRQGDRYRQSMWLEHLYQRFTLARDLLTPDGVMLVFINDENRSRLELLLDQVMPGMRVGSFVWRTRSGSNDVTGPRLSVDHEHVLVYARSRFAFAGLEKDFADYRYDDGDGHGLWASKDLSVGVSYDDPRAGNAYYPLHDPHTDTWYPCNPNRVWGYVTRERAAPGTTFKSFTMDDLVEQERIKWPEDGRVEVWETLDALYDAIDRGDVPRARSVALLRRGLPEIESWVGRRVGFGRPRLKKYLREVTEHRQPVSSWIRPQAEDSRAADDDEVELVSSYGEEGGQVLQAMFARKVFNYPKPLSLVVELLRQATRPGDLVLDFYAGSGTTAHAVALLNAEDAARGEDLPRRFVLASSTEATAGEPDKNLCRDVCARRLKFVAEGYAGQPGIPCDFAYLRVVRLAPEDVPYDLTPELVWHVLVLRHTGAAAPFPDRPVNYVRREGGQTVVYCPRVTEAALAELAALEEAELVVYSDRPESVREALAGAGRHAASHSAVEAAVSGGAS